jgi:hypothetical protein
MTVVAQGFTSVMAQRRDPPDAVDYFPTPLWASRALFRHVLPALGIESVDRVWEPACGERHMAAVITEFARKRVLASDIFDYSYGTAPHDFLHDDPLTKPDWVVTNPPFNLACEFTLRALELATEGVAMLVRTQWIEGVGRYEKLFRDRPPTLYARRQPPRTPGSSGASRSSRSRRASFGYRPAAAPPSPFLMIVGGLQRGH